MKVEKAVTMLPAWKIAEVIDRLEEWGSKEQKEGTFSVHGFGEISAGETGLKFRTVSRFFHERVTDDGRKVRAERTLIDRANKGKSDKEITKVREVLVKELKRRDIRYRSPIGTAGDYQRATSVDGAPKAIRDIVIRDYDLDEEGKVRPFIQELLRKEGIQAVAIQSDKGAEHKEAINELENTLREKKRWIGWNETAKSWAFTFAALFLIAAPISSYVLQPPAGVDAGQQLHAQVATVQQPVGVAVALSCIAAAVISLGCGINWSVVKDKLENILRERTRWKGWKESTKIRALSFAALFLIAAPMSYCVLHHPAGVQTGQQPPRKVVTVQRLPVGVATALSCIVFSFILLVLGINWRAAKHKLDISAEELEFERDLLKFPVELWETRAEKTLLQNDKRLRRYYDQNLGENKKVLYVGVICIVLGVAILVGTVYAIYFLPNRDLKIITAVLGAVGSLLTNYVAAIYLGIHAAASKNLGTFHGRLVDTHQVLLANMIASRIDENNKRWDTFAMVAENIAKHEDKSAGKEDKEGEEGKKASGQTTVNVVAKPPRD